ncbi:MAG: FtsX-like permease family protein [Luteitalea sp.]|nr:FtsX-like permease family protein [Luteitalea sp.]
MSTRRLVAHSVQALARYRLRTCFIMVGSLVGVAALTFVVSVGQGAKRKMLTTVRQIFGESSIMIGAGGHQMMGGPRPGAARLTLDDIEAVAKALPEVELWDAQQTMSASVRRGDATATARVLGQSERSERVRGRSVSRGVYFDAGAVKRLERVALIGETVAKDLFEDEDPLDAGILIESVPFTVIGVLEPFGTDLHGMDRDNEIVVPVSTLMRRLTNVDTIAAARLLVKDPQRIEDTAREITRLLRARHALAVGQPDDFSILTPVEVQRMVGTVQRVLSLYLPLAAAVTLVVGGIVAATLMLASVNARVGEIGLRRAVGAHPQDIRLQFLVETAVTTAGGGLGGIVLGLAAGQLVATRLELGAVFSWSAVLLGLLMSGLTGLLAGVVPARRAARLLPADALR